ncbi:MAG: hypothetical protein BroJett018_52440 [Chloroflexota bacterium]|nr:MAG: hypothetical protein BroJett018_52440 [Chloroflexota bacterium]
MREQAHDTYIQNIQRELGTGIALKALLETLGDFHAINDAAHLKDVGAPDFILLRDRRRVGFVEVEWCVF